MKGDIFMKNTIYRFILGLVVVFGLLIINGNLHLPHISNDSDITDTSTEGNETPTGSPEANEENVHKDNKAKVGQQTEQCTNTNILEINAETPVSSEVPNIVNTEAELQSSASSSTDKKEEAIPADVEQTITSSDKAVSTELSSSDILKMLSASLVSSSTGYAEHYGDSINVFSEDVENFFSINTAVWYNMWGGNKQTVVYSTKKLKEHGSDLSFNVGMMSGGKGLMNIQIFVSNQDNPDYEFVLDATQAPQMLTINIANGDSLKIKVINEASVQNKAVFFNFKINSEEV